MTTKKSTKKPQPASTPARENLALLYSVASEPDATGRENYVIAVEGKLLPMCVAACRAIDAVVERRVSEAMKGETVN